MSTPVKLYVYDLSNGLARQMSLQLTGRQLDGIWHTSIVIWGQEISYGQGINITPPGRSHLGQPLQMIDMGETSIDQETFQEYLAEMRQVYTADKYHLLDFNCNSFTQDVIGFLTGGSIPPWIKDLPSDFLSTPFGAALRPTIDNMYRSAGTTIPPMAAAQASPNPSMAASLLQSVAGLAAQPGNGVPNGVSNSSTNGVYHPNPATATIAAPIQICTNPSSFNSLLASHRALVVFFTSSTCGPCKMIEPTFEAIAHEKTHGRAGDALPGFVKIDLNVGLSGQIASQYSVRATPTFIFFLDGKKIGDIKGVDHAELRTQVDLLLFQAFPPHPHTKLNLPAVQAISLNPILFTQVPPLPTVFAKFSASIKAIPEPAELNKGEAEKTLARVLPYLQGLVTSRNEKGKPIPPVQPALLASWAVSTAQLVTALPSAQLFPLFDMWRLAFLDPAVTNWLASGSLHINPLDVILKHTRELLADSDAAVATRNTILTALRLLANALGPDVLAHTLIVDSAPVRATDVLVPGLLHADGAVRTAAASVAFNLAAAIQRSRVERVKAGRSDALRDTLDGEWEVEMLSAVVEAIRREESSEDVVHRLVASLALVLRLSPTYGEEMVPLLEVLQTKETLLAKLKASFVQKPEIQKLINEVSSKLCP